jgi:hypothetical protein
VPVSGVSESTGPEGPGKSITERDLIDYLVGGGTPELRGRIAAEKEISGSQVALWLDQMRAKLADPFNVDWGGLSTSEEGRGGKEPAEKADGQGKS